MSEPTSGYSFKYFWTNLLQSGFNSSQTFISTKQRFSFFYNKLKVLTQARNPGEPEILINMFPKQWQFLLGSATNTIYL